METLYHITPAKNLRRILKNGLKPKIGRLSRQAQEKTPKIYLFRNLTDTEDALANWFGKQFDEEERLAILEIVFPKRKIKTEQFGFEVTTHHRIPPDYIKLLRIE